MLACFVLCKIVFGTLWISLSLWLYSACRTLLSMDGIYIRLSHLPLADQSYMWVSELQYLCMAICSGDAQVQWTASGQLPFLTVAQRISSLAAGISGSGFLESFWVFLRLWHNELFNIKVQLLEPSPVYLHFWKRWAGGNFFCLVA